MFPRIRTRRNRSKDSLRRLARQTQLTTDDLILPVFVADSRNKIRHFERLPEFICTSVDIIARFVEKISVPAVILFGVPDIDKRNSIASYALDEKGLVPVAVRKIKKIRPDMAVITDVCLCAYTDHGHCGVIKDEKQIDNDATIKMLAKMAVVHAASGADIVAPSAMMDGQVAAIRDALDENGFTDTAIMSYAAKFTSNLYGPFRDVVQSTPTFGDRSSYQLPITNSREAIRDAMLDESEGADWLMVKPAMLYLDILYELRQRSYLPIAAYQVSGEYAMIKLASQQGQIQEREMVLESLICIKRAGADAIITYYAEKVSKWLGS